jgi:hypothetical protein
MKQLSQDSQPLSKAIDSPEPSHSYRFWGLLRQRACLMPTLRGWMVLGLCFAVFLVVLIGSLHPFLAVNDPISDGLLVVEGWSPDYGLEIAAAEFRRDHYQKIYVTGGPLERGTHLSAYQTYAQLGAATLIKLGLDSNVVQAVPAPYVRQDRTYTAAASLKKWLIEHGIRPTRIHLMSDGAHARRSRLLYHTALGDGVFIGVTSIPSEEYDPQRWWRYSAGVRNLMSEGLAYLYARFLFFPPKE